MAAATAIAIAGLAIGVAGTAMQYSAQKQAGAAQQRLNEMNAELDRQAAENQARDASVRANAMRAQKEALLGKTRAAYAASGVVTGTGSPLLVESEQAGAIELSALQTAWEGKVKATELRNQANLALMGGNAAMSAANTAANATLVSSAGRLTEQGYSAYKSGMFSTGKN